MPVRLSGLISGMDTESLVQELVSAYSIKKDKYVKEQTKMEWQMDAWKSLNTKVYSFYTSKLSGLRFSNAYSKKAVTVSDKSKATITADTNAVNGTQTLAINKLAKTGYLTGAQLKGYTDAEGKTQKITASTKLKDLNGGITSGVINVKVNGKETNIDVTEDMNIGQLVSHLKDAGLNASFDETNQRMFISSKTSGVAEDFSLTGNTDGIATLKALGVYSVSNAEIEQSSRVASFTDDDLKNFAVNEYLKSQINDANKTYTSKNAELNEENSKLSSKASYAKLTSDKKASAYVGVKEKIAKLQEELDELNKNPDENAAKIEAKNKEIESQKETLAMYDEVNSVYGITVSGDKADEATVNIVKEPSSDELNAYIQGINDKISANKEEITANSEAVAANQKLVEKNMSTADAEAVEFTSYGGTKSTIGTSYETSDGYKAIYAKYEDMRTAAIDTMDKVAAATGADGKVDMSQIAAALGASDGVRIEGSDSEIVLNGATFTSNTNNYSINGLTITANAVTEPDEVITVNTNTDVDGIYNMIKDYIKSYNELIKEMDTLYNASSSKGYEPLTDEEKDAMSDTEVEKWEKKIKDSLLRRDSTLSGVINSMKTAMTTAVEIDGVKYSLSSFGISTMGYFGSGENEKGVYHIDGDADDGSTSGKTDKLRAAIASDPDKIVEFFSKLTTNMYDSLTKKMAGSSVSSSYTIYNDKAMKKKYEQYDDTIDKWEEKLTAIEDKYYKQFAAMETAMAKLQSSTSALSSLMGS